MSSLYFTDDHQLFRDTARQFVEKEVVPQIEEWEQQKAIPSDIWQRMGELGFLGIHHSEKWGGTEADFFYSVVWMEELARCTAAGFVAAVSVHQYMATNHLAAAGSDFLKEKYLKAAIQGEMIGALAISEPNAGSDVAAIQTHARLEGNDYILNGQKTFITNGVLADFIVVACQTEEGISLLVVDGVAEGLSRKQLKKVGWHCSDTAELFFDQVKVPKENVIGEAGKGFYYLMESFQLERLVAAVMSYAGAEHGLEITMQYLGERAAFGRKLQKFQTIRHTIANLSSETEAIRQFTLSTCWKFDQGDFLVKECSMAKLLATELGKKVADQCLQFFGGYGYMEEYPIARMYRDARVATIVGGTSEIMREIIAKMVLEGVEYEQAYENADTAVAEVKQNNDSKSIIREIATMNEKPTKANEIIKSLATRLRTEELREGYTTNFHFDISGDNGGQFTVKIADGGCTVEEGFHDEPNCKVSSKAETYEQIELGKTNPQIAVMMGRIKISNIPAMLIFTKLFHRLY